MTKVRVQNFGWMYIVFIVDWYSKKMVRYYMGTQCRAKHWLMTLNMAENRQLRDGIQAHEVNLMSDNGSQPTERCTALSVKQTFTSYNNPKENADTERMCRTLKEELV